MPTPIRFVINPEGPRLQPLEPLPHSGDTAIDNVVRKYNKGIRIADTTALVNMMLIQFPESHSIIEGGHSYTQIAVNPNSLIKFLGISALKQFTLLKSTPTERGQMILERLQALREPVDLARANSEASDETERATPQTSYWSRIHQAVGPTLGLFKTYGHKAVQKALPVMGQAKDKVDQLKARLCSAEIFKNITPQQIKIASWGALALGTLGAGLLAKSFFWTETPPVVDPSIGEIAYGWLRLVACAGVV